MTVAYVKYLGDTSNKTAGTTLGQVLQGGGSAAGNLIVAHVIFDNAATASKPVVSSISKMAGETNNWVFLGAARSTSTSAGAFASGETWCILTTVAWSGTITVTLDTSVTQKAVLMQEFSGVQAVARNTVGTNYSTTTTAASAATTGTTPSIGDLAIGLMFGSNVAAQPAGDNDTTAGSWSAVAGLGSTGSSGATNNFGGAQYKVLTAATHQTINNQAAMTAGNGAIVAILQSIPDPAITQAAYQFFDQGTETGSISLGALNTPITGDVTVGDGIGALRVRLQLTTAAVPLATDDWQLQWEKNASGTWVNVGSAVLASYSETNRDSGQLIGGSAGGTSAVAVSFQGDGKKLFRVGFYLQRTGSPGGNLSASLFTHTGTYGGPGTLSGNFASALTNSTTSIAATSVGTGSFAWYYFDFDATYTLANGTAYYIALKTSLSSGSDTNYVQWGSDASSPTWPGDTKVCSGYGGSSWANVAADLIFSVSTGDPTVAPYNDPNLTDAAATTNRLGAGTGSFVAGKVSETGAVNDFTWTGSNYTELLFPVTISKPAFVNGDAIRFRVLRNGVTTFMTYTQVPLINVTKTEVAVSQAAYRFYGSGPENSQPALAAQNTPVNSDISSGDVYESLRVRLQSTTAAPLSATDDWQLQYKKNDPVLLDSYPVSNFSANNILDNGISGIGQSFLGNGQSLSRAGFYIARQGTADGSVYAQLYAHSGTFGTSSLPTGPPLAISAPIPSASISTSQAMVYFDFTGYTLANGTPYVIVLFTDTTTVSAFWVGVDNTSPTHAGNFSSNTLGSWAGTSTGDTIFEVYTGGAWTNIGAGGVVTVDGAAHATAQAQDASGTNTTITQPSVGTFTAGALIVTAGGCRISGTAWTGLHAEYGTADQSTANGYLSCLAAHKTPAGTSDTNRTATNTGATNGQWVAASVALTPAPLLRGYASAFPATSATVNVTLPAGSVAGDLAVVISFGDKTFVQLPSGFTQIDFNNANAAEEIRSSYKALTATDITNGYVTLPGDNNFNGVRHCMWVTYSAVVVPFDEPFLTDTEPTTNRLTGGTGTFVAGKVSLTGLASNVGWSGNNFTELLYSLQILAASNVNGDILQFRVLRNGVTTGMTYTQTPQVNTVTGPVTVQATISTTFAFTATAIAVPQHAAAIATTFTFTATAAATHIVGPTEAYFRMDGTTGRYISTPHTSKLNITGDIEIVARVAFDDWADAARQPAIISKWGSGTSRSWSWQAYYYFRFAWTADGTNANIIDVGYHNFVNGTTHWVKVTFDADNGSGGRTARIYQAPDGPMEPTSWAEVDTGITTTPATSMLSNSQAVQIAGTASGTSNMAPFNIYRAIIRDGIGGPVVAHFDPREYVSGSSFVSSLTGETWTLNGTPTWIPQGIRTIFTFTATAAATAVTPTVVPATISTTFTFTATAAATVTTPATIQATVSTTFAFTATATATPVHPATIATTFDFTATATAIPQHPATISTTFTFTATAVAVPIRPATISTTFAFTATAAADVTHSAAIATTFTFTATAAAAVSGNVEATIATTFAFTASATAAPSRPATIATTFIFTAVATATPQHDATITTAFVFTAVAAAVLQHDATIATTFPFTATAVAVPTHSAAIATTFVFTATAIAVPTHEATISTLFAFTATAVAAPSRPATIATTFVFTATAAASISHQATISTTFDFTATATAVPVSPGQATIATTFVFTATATAVPQHPASISTTFLFTATSTATPVHPATISTTWTFTATATATLTHPATITTTWAFTATATATVVSTAVTVQATIATQYTFTALATAKVVSPYTVLNTADAIYVGAQSALAVYAGSTKVWPGL